MTRFTLGLALLLGVLAASASPAWADRDVRVPRVEDLSLEEALRLLQDADLHPHVEWTVEGRRGRVSAQEPIAGRAVPVGSTVVLKVRRRLEIRTLVPDVVHMDEAEAIAALEDVYVLEIEERRVRRDKAGTILGQDPRAGSQLPMGGVLRLVVGRAANRGRVAIPVPDVTKLPHAEAEEALLDLGLIPVASFFQVRRGRPGYVHTQSPAPDALVGQGDRVVLDVGVPARPHRGHVRVPSLYGLDPTEAEEILAALALRAQVQRLPSRYEANTVVRQRPAAGSQIVVGSALSLVVAVPAGPAHVPAHVSVPDLVGAELAEAFARARRAGIRLSVSHRRARGHRDAGVVMNQRPTPHVAVPLGTRVRVEVPVGVQVPELVGLSPDAAAERAWEAGLQIEFAGHRRARFGAVVVAQEPEAGTLVGRGVAVRVKLQGSDRQEQALVPDVRTRTVTDARQRLRQAGLEGRFVGPKPVPGATLRVVTQRPTPGTRVPRATIVEVVYRVEAPAQGQYVLVPDLAGLTLHRARTRLLDLGLTPVASTVRGPGAKGVTGQAPAPGTRVRQGTQVAFTVRQ